MKHIAVVNAGPRKGWNTDRLLVKAAEGARSEGAEAEIIDLYRLEKYTGCVSCFGCKTEGRLGRCVCRDGLAPALEKIRAADGLVLGSPVYLGEVTAACRALLERLIFPLITYKERSGSSRTCTSAPGRRRSRKLRSRRRRTVRTITDRKETSHEAESRFHRT